MVLVGLSLGVAGMVVVWLLVLMRPSGWALAAGEVVLEGTSARLALHAGFVGVVAALGGVAGLVGAGPAESPSMRLATAVATTLVVLAAVLAHELGHLTAARLLPSITQATGCRAELLFRLNGGRCRVPAAPPAADLLIALAGPLTNLLLGMAAALLASSVAGEAGAAARLIQVHHLALGLAACLPLPASDLRRAAGAMRTLLRGGMLRDA